MKKSILLLILIVTSLSGYSQETSTHINGEPKLPTWMQGISDNTKIDNISIPGTHDSGALYGGGLAECQTLSIRQQLDLGIRFLDIRCNVESNGDFTIHHGVTYQYQTFQEVLDQVIPWLNNHPTETVLMRIKQENSSVPDTQFINRFNQYMSYNESNYGKTIFEDGYHGYYGNVPTLGAVRGKIVVVSNVSGLAGIQWNSMDIEDDYHVPTLFHRWHKFEQTRDHINLCDNNKANNPYDNKIYLSFANGSSAFAWPKDVAYVVNPALSNFLSGKTIKTGIVAIDFAADGNNTTYKIVSTNW